VKSSPKAVFDSPSGPATDPKFWIQFHKSRKLHQSLLDLDLEKDKLPMQRTLGLHGDMESDTFMFKVAPKDRPNTRRGILSLTSSLYDPLGFVAPVVLPAKKLLQDLCREKRGWDDSISDCDGERSEKWQGQLANLFLITVDKCVKPACF